MEEKNVSVPTGTGNEKAAETVADCFSDFDFSKMEISIEEMFKNGVHFGHHKSRKNPKMDDFIFGVKMALIFLICKRQLRC